MNYIWHLLVYLEIYMLVSLSLNLLIGYSGLLHVAQAAYMGIGAYSAALVWTRLDWSFAAGMVTAGLVAGILSFLVSLPAKRFREDAFVMISLAVQIFLVALFTNWTELTGGPHGIFNIPKPAILGSKFSTPAHLFVVYGLITGLLAGLLWVLQKSPIGNALKATRDDPTSARSVGIRVNRLRTEVFFISATVTGLAGAMLAAYLGFIDPSYFSINESILLISMVIVGGTGNMKGPLLGACLLVLLPELIKLLPFSEQSAPHVHVLVYGLLLILVVRLRPRGLAGNYNFE